MITVKLSKRGNPQWYAQQFDLHLGKLEPMVIPDCGRCLGLFIFWKSKTHNNMQAVSGAHINPFYGKALRLVHKKFRRELQDSLKGYVPYLIVVGGGRINTPQNKVLYRSSIKKFVRPFEYLFPNIQIGGFTPDKNTAYTTMILAEDYTMKATQKIFATVN